MHIEMETSYRVSAGVSSCASSSLFFDPPESLLALSDCKNGGGNPHGMTLNLNNIQRMMYKNATIKVMTAAAILIS